MDDAGGCIGILIGLGIIIALVVYVIIPLFTIILIGGGIIGVGIGLFCTIRNYVNAIREVVAESKARRKSI